jgi:hypothetical protein
MKTAKIYCAVIAIITLIAMPGATALGDEGMWPFNYVPKVMIKQRYGFDVADQWLLNIQRGTARFDNGGTGALVSANGLLITNYHVALDAIQQLSTPQRNIIKDGFHAPVREQELKVPKLEINFLMSIEDVTARLNEAVKPGMSAAEAEAARRNESVRVAAESEKATGLVSNVMIFYHGARYGLYRYKRYRDVRLVFAPESDIATFGGETDNFTYPRYGFDMALFRIYENDQPVKVENYLKWSPTGARPDELVFVAGHPISTERLNTVAHLEYLQTAELPLVLKQLKRQSVLLRRYTAKGEAQSIRVKEQLFNCENGIKALEGRFQGFQNPALMERKRREEADFRKLVSADPKKQQEYGDAWEAIERSRKSLATYEPERRFLDELWGFNSDLFRIAREHVRLAGERAKPESERIPGFNDALLKRLENKILGSKLVLDDFEEMKLADSLAFMSKELGTEHPVVRMALADKSPEARAAELIAKSKLNDLDYRKQLVAGGQRAVEESDDPVLALMRVIDPRGLALRKRFQEEVLSVDRASYPKIGRARYSIYGTQMYPDATFTLRLSYGTVRGYSENNKKLPPFTYFSGLFERAARYHHRSPFNLPGGWLAKQQELTLKTPLSFVTTHDVVAGFSGSPVLNKSGELVGLLFDSNLQALTGKVAYDGRQSRAIALDARGIIEALNKIYGATELVAELTRR